MYKIVISKDFSETPGARQEVEGSYSGEKFRDELLIPFYQKAVKENKKLVVDLDGCYGFATSFLEESFGGMVRILKKKGVLNTIEIMCTEDASLEALIREYVREAEERL